MIDHEDFVWMAPSCEQRAGKVPRNWTMKWTSEEDERLKCAISNHGFAWSKIAVEVGTRDAQKCYQRWEKVLKPDIVKGHWSQEEDDKLVELIAENLSNWGEISKRMGTRTSKQCRERWINYLDPSLNQQPWSKEEDAQLLQLQLQLGSKWAAIAKEMKGRSENALRCRFLSLEKKLQKASLPLVRRKRKLGADTIQNSNGEDLSLPEESQHDESKK